MRIIVAVIWMSFFLSGCQSESDDSGCLLGDDNYLSDADFALEAESSRSKHWTGMQHTGEKSFKVTFENSTAVIEKVGSQPWFLYRQRLKANEFVDKKMAFSAEVKLSQSLDGSTQANTSAGGLKLSVLTSSGKPILRVESMLQPEGEENDWQYLQLVVLMPKAAQRVALSFFHDSEGTLRVRNPSFREVDSASENCNVAKPI